MPCRHATLAAVAAAVACLLVAAAGDAEADEALAQDDHCRAADGACTLNALQARARKVAAAAAAQPAAAAASAAKVGASVAAPAAAAGAARSNESWGSCQAYGCSTFRRHQTCQCNWKCVQYRNCCPDFQAVCVPGGAGAQAAPAASAMTPGSCYYSGKSYKLSWKAQGRSFFDDWTFVTEDMVHGAHQFTTKSEAEATGVIAADAGSARLAIGGLRPPSRPGEAYKRYAPHIRTNQAWDPKTSFIVAMKYNRVPSGCGVWPGFWTVNSDVVWPDGGELDILEYANYDANKVTFHVGTHCRLDTSRMHQCAPPRSGGSGSSDCYTSYFHNAFGCRPSQHRRRADEYNQGPGVLASQWTPDAITAYYFPDGQVPADLTSDAPEPDKWSRFVIAYLPFASRCEAIGPQELVLNIQLCGDAAGGLWTRSPCAKLTWAESRTGRCHGGLSEPTDCCTQFVTRPDQEPVLKANAQFNVSWVKVFTPDGAPGRPSGTFKRGGQLLW